MYSVPQLYRTSYAVRSALTKAGRIAISYSLFTVITTFSSDRVHGADYTACNWSSDLALITIYYSIL